MSDVLLEVKNYGLPEAMNSLQLHAASHVALAAMPSAEIGKCFHERDFWSLAMR
jgi:hypothetical protein